MPQTLPLSPASRFGDVLDESIERACAQSKRHHDAIVQFEFGAVTVSVTSATVTQDLVLRVLAVHDGNTKQLVGP